jgi:hypothetical protein
MALAEQARRVAGEFDFGPDAVNKAVKEFIREMGTQHCPGLLHSTCTNTQTLTDNAQMRA